MISMNMVLVEVSFEQARFCESIIGVFNKRCMHAIESANSAESGGRDRKNETESAK